MRTQKKTHLDTLNTGSNLSGGAVSDCGVMKCQSYMLHQHALSKSKLFYMINKLKKKTIFLMKLFTILVTSQPVSCLLLFLSSKWKILDKKVEI